jgi:hypothetical protein
MRDFIEDLKYMVSASNTTSRGFYIFVTVVLILLLILAPISIVVAILYAMAGNSFVAPLAIGLLSVAALIAVIIWLKKS